MLRETFLENMHSIIAIIVMLLQEIRIFSVAKLLVELYTKNRIPCHLKTVTNNNKSTKSRSLLLSYSSAFNVQKNNAVIFRSRYDIPILYL